MATLLENDIGSQATQSWSVDIRNLTKSFRLKQSNVIALQQIDLQIQRGEFLCVVGPSGCGKTTLLNILGGLETPTSGSIDFAKTTDNRPLRSIVFQEQGVFPWMTVLENTAFGLRVRGIAREERHAVARRILKDVGIAEFEAAYPRQLSGGMRQRVNLARALANDPQILLMDEPFANLDEQTKLIIQDDLLHIWERDRKTVLFITHSVDEAIRLADRIIVMTARPGRIKTEIKVTLPRPRSVFDIQNDVYVDLRNAVWDALKYEILTPENRRLAS